MKGARAFLLALVVLAFGTGARADVAPDEAPEALFKKGALALRDGAVNDAVEVFEMLADRGFVHPDASFDRAVAYLGRARSPQKQPGDLGRAAAALAETLALRPGDREAESALEAVRQEIGRTRARRGGAPLIARPRLLRALVALMPEPAWGALAALGSVSLAWGLALRLLLRRTGSEVPGALGIGVGGLLLCLGGGLAAGARHFRKTSTLAVVVVPEARLLDENGRPLPARSANDNAVAPEGAELVVVEHRGGLDRVEWGTTDGWVIAGQIREVEHH